MATLTVKKDFVIWNNGSISIKDTKLTRDQVLSLSVKDMARYANFRLKQIGSDPWFLITKKEFTTKQQTFLLLVKNRIFMIMPLMENFMICYLTAITREQI